jgi:putative endonuclease
MYYIYILHSDIADKFYVGFSSNPWNRIIQHNTNSKEKFTGKVNDWCLKAVFAVSESRADVMKMEKFIKNQKSKLFLKKLVDRDFIPTGKLALLVRVPHVRD